MWLKIAKNKYARFRNYSDYARDVPGGFELLKTLTPEAIKGLDEFMDAIYCADKEMLSKEEWQPKYIAEKRLIYMPKERLLKYGFTEFDVKSAWRDYNEYLESREDWTVEEAAYHTPWLDSFGAYLEFGNKEAWFRATRNNTIEFIGMTKDNKLMFIK